MIGYDLFIKKDPADLVPKQEDEDVDISDEAGKFQPIVIERERKDGISGKRADPQDGEQPKDRDDEKVKDGKPLPDGSSSNGTPQAKVIDEEDEPRNRKSLSDTGKKKENTPSVELTDEEKARLDKFKQEVKDKPTKATVKQEAQGESEAVLEGQSEDKSSR